VRIFPESLVYQKSREENSENVEDRWLKFQREFQDRAEDKTRKKSNIFLSSAMPPIKIKSGNYSESYQKEKELIIPRMVTGEVTKKSAPESVLAEAETLFKQKQYVGAIEKAEKALESDSQNYDAYCLIAQIYANLGEYDRAELYCKKAIEVENFSVNPYYLLVHIAEERGEREKAKTLLKRIIYLCPSSISAYVELADIYENEGQTMRARKMKNTALELLKKLPENALVEYRGEIAASDFIKYLKQLLLKN
jgi:chemotaxis protein methyltransferase CheR